MITTPEDNGLSFNLSWRPEENKTESTICKNVQLTKCHQSTQLWQCKKLPKLKLLAPVQSDAYISRPQTDLMTILHRFMYSKDTDNASNSLVSKFSPISVKTI